MVGIARTVQAHAGAVDVVEPFEAGAPLPGLACRIIEVLIDAGPDGGAAVVEAVGLGAVPLVEDVFPAVRWADLEEQAVPRAIGRYQHRGGLEERREVVGLVARDDREG